MLSIQFFHEQFVCSIRTNFCPTGVMHQEPLLSLILSWSCTFDLSLFITAVEMCLSSIKLMYRVALAYFDFVSGNLCEVLYLEKNRTATFYIYALLECLLGAWLGPGVGLVATCTYCLHFSPLKGTGTRDYNWLKVVWYDGSWLGESGRYSKIF